MTEEVKRYSLCEDCWEMQAYEDGTFVAYEDYKDVIDAKDARIAELEKHLKWWGSYGIIEVMIRNPGIKSFVEEHEQRIADLERQLADMDAALRRIMDHGMPSESDTTQTWLRCSMSVYRIARDALEHGGTHDHRK